MAIGDTTARSDLKLTGESSSSGGVFDKVKITGEADIHGAVDCDTFKCTGSTRMQGSLNMDSFKLTGDMIIQGSISGGKLKSIGNVKISDNLMVEQISMTGELNVGGKISAEECSIYGSVVVQGDIESEQFKLKGQLDTDGMLNAEHVQIELRGSSKSREIVGRTINIAPHKGINILPLLSSWVGGELKANSIEGDEVNISHTVANVVRGDQVTIGPECRIELVEYRGQLDQHPKAVIVKCVKL